MVTRYPRLSRLLASLALAVLVASPARAGDPKDAAAAARIAARLPLALKLLPGSLRAADPDAGALLREAGLVSEKVRGSMEVLRAVQRFQLTFRRNVILPLRPDHSSSVGEGDLDSSQDDAFDRARRRYAARLAAYLAEQKPAVPAEVPVVGDGDAQGVRSSAEEVPSDQGAFGQG